MSRFQPDSDAVWKLKGQIGEGLMKHGPAFVRSKEFKELQRMLKEVREVEAMKE